MIRNEFWSLIRGTSDLFHDAGREDMLAEEAVLSLGHLKHCMDYIRQLILCQADMTVEVAAKYPAPNGQRFHIDGLGMSHECKDQVRGLLYRTANME